MSNQQIATSNEWVTSPSQSLLSKRDRDIYMLGKENEVKELLNEVEGNFKENLTKSYADTLKILNKIKEENLEILSARLKVLYPGCLKVAISIKETEEISSHIEAIYNFIYDLEEEQNTDNYNVDFSIIKANEYYDEKNIENDGYIYKHLLFLNEKRTRRS